jgi:site-specific recombinase XerD
MDYLSERGLVAFPSQPCPPKQKILQEYLDHLKYERHLVETTVKAHQMYITPLLEGLGAAPVKALYKLSPEQVLVFFTNHAQDRGLSSRRYLRQALRSFFRFCHQKGYLERDLAEAVPQIRHYRLSDVPRGVSDEDARKTLEAIDRTTPIGRRDFAMIQLLHTYGVRGAQVYGVRGAQVRALRVEDIRWRENRVRFPACKGGKEVIEPLTEEVGESLLEYMRYGRPQALCPEVFLTVHPPYRPLQPACRLSTIVTERMRKAGVSRPKGSHGFRHGFATRMLRHGQSIKTIADLLGHRNINSTFIYTKVDLKTLAQLPLDWPEV